MLFMNISTFYPYSVHHIKHANFSFSRISPYITIQIPKWVLSSKKWILNLLIFYIHVQSKFTTVITHKRLLKISMMHINIFGKTFDCVLKRVLEIKSWHPFIVYEMTVNVIVLYFIDIFIKIINIYIYIVYK